MELIFNNKAVKSLFKAPRGQKYPPPPPPPPINSILRGFFFCLFLLLTRFAFNAKAQTVGTVQIASDTLIYPEAPGGGSDSILQTGVTLIQIAGSIKSNPNVSL